MAAPTPHLSANEVDALKRIGRSPDGVILREVLHRHLRASDEVCREQQGIARDWAQGHGQMLQALIVLLFQVPTPAKLVSKPALSEIEERGPFDVH